ncbi:hypothetical protein D3C87_1804870 [compost metagenome]
MVIPFLPDILIDLGFHAHIGHPEYGYDQHHGNSNANYSEPVFLAMDFGIFRNKTQIAFHSAYTPR